MGRKYTPAQAAASKKYDEKTYKIITLRLRIDDDADIIESMQKSRDKGIPNREWLRDLFEK